MRRWTFLVGAFLAIMMPVHFALAAADVRTMDQLRVTQGSFDIPNFHFQDGETMPALRMHYRTLGTPLRNSSGQVTNAVLIMHGTGGTGAQFLSPRFADVLFKSGELLDASKHYIILPDDIGHGGSSKPSDGLRMHFPHYNYHDMVEAEYALVTQGLHVNHLRLVMGTSMGCMHSWMWGEMWPNFMDALMPLACLPAGMAGRNWVWRQMLVDSITADPAWDGGNYASEPQLGLVNAAHLLLMVVSDPHHWRESFPTPKEATTFVHKAIDNVVKHADANDMIYQFLSSRDYDPSAQLGQIKAWVMAVNSADDQVNPVGVDDMVMATEMEKVKHGSYIILPVSDQTHGHGTHTIPAVWDQWLWKLLKESNPGQQPVAAIRLQK